MFLRLLETFDGRATLVEILYSWEEFKQFVEVLEEAFFIVDGFLECCSGACGGTSEFFVLLICFEDFPLVFLFEFFSLLVEGFLDCFLSF